MPKIGSNARIMLRCGISLYSLFLAWYLVEMWRWWDKSSPWGRKFPERASRVLLGVSVGAQMIQNWTKPLSLWAGVEEDSFKFFFFTTTEVEGFTTKKEKHEAFAKWAEWHVGERAVSQRIYLGKMLWGGCRAVSTDRKDMQVLFYKPLKQPMWYWGFSSAA